MILAISLASLQGAVFAMWQSRKKLGKVLKFQIKQKTGLPNYNAWIATPYKSKKRGARNDGGARNDAIHNNCK
jgi:hypothetical protein